MPNPEEIVRLVEEMFACKAIGLYPVSRKEFPAWYKCPCCGVYADASQQCVGMEHIERAPHEPECKAMKLLETVRAWRKEQSADDWPPYELVGC